MELRSHLDIFNKLGRVEKQNTHTHTHTEDEIARDTTRLFHSRKIALA